MVGVEKSCRMEVELIQGGSYADARGSLRFCNDFDMSEVKRFYTISNSAAEPQRGWIMHKRETKWLFPLRAKTKVGVEKVGGERISYLLDAAEPCVLHIPPNHWFCIEQDGTAEVQVFSDCRPGEFKDDDFRRSL